MDVLSQTSIFAILPRLAWIKRLRGALVKICANAKNLIGIGFKDHFYMYTMRSGVKQLKEESGMLTP